MLQLWKMTHHYLQQMLTIKMSPQHNPSLRTKDIPHGVLTQKNPQTHVAKQGSLDLAFLLVSS